MNSRNSSQTADVWTERFGRFQATDMTVAQFCQSEGVSLAAYYYWRRKLRNPPKPTDQNTRAISVPERQPAFLPVALAANSDARIADPAAAMTIDLPGGIRIRLEVPMENPGEQP